MTEDQYTLDRFFRVQSDFALPKKGTIYLRSLSDDEMGMRQKAAVLAARNKRLELRDESSAAFIELVDVIQYAVDEELVDTIVSLSEPQFQREALEAYPRRHIPYPDDAELEEQMDTDEKRDQHWEEIFKQRKEHVEKRSEKHRTEVEEWPREKRVSKCQNLQISNEAMAAYIQEENAQLILLGSFSNKKRTKPYFSSVADVRELSPKVKEPLLIELRRLNEVDIFAVQGFSSTAS